MQLTALRCEMSGVADLLLREGAGAAREARRGFQTLCERVFVPLPGHLAERSPEGWLVYFWKNEDDTRSALRAALTVVNELEEFARSNAAGWSGWVRVAVHTATATVARGEASGDAEVIPFVSECDQEVLRALLGLRGGSGVFLSRSTYDLIERRFDCAKSDEDVPTGGGGRAEAFRLLVEKERNRFVYEPTPLVGRAGDLQTLLDRWALAKEGRTQVVFLSGEPGSGKSRLLYELRDRVKADAPEIREWQCWLQYQNTSLHPMVDMLERAFGFREGDTAAAKRAKLESGLRGDGHTPAEALPLLAVLLSLSPAPPDVKREALKEKTLGVLVSLLRQMADRGPVLLLGEDLHWCDPTTLDLLGRAIAEQRDARVLMVLTYRTNEFKPPWREYSNQTSIRLDALPREDVARMIAAISEQKHKAVSPADVDRVAAHADGLPLFVEELTLAVLAGSGEDESADRPIPATLWATLASTLERLGSAKEVAQIAAVIGREFAPDLLAVVSGMTPGELEPHLRGMIDAEVAYPIGHGPAGRFLFKHILIQEKAYDSVPPARRRNLHRTIARALEGRTDPPPELLADHWTKAGSRQRAVFYWQAAGEAALLRAAIVEAGRHFETGSEVLNGVAEGPERDRLDLQLHSGLSLVIIALQGFGSEDHRRITDVMLPLLERAGQPVEEYRVVNGMWQYWMMRGDLRQAATLGARLRGVAQKQGDPRLRMGACFAEGLPLLYYGDVAAGADRIRETLRDYDEENHSFNKPLYDDDPGFAARGFGAVAGTLLAEFALALAGIDSLLTLARRIPDQFRLSTALSFASNVHALRLDLDALHAVNAECADVSGRLRFPAFLAGTKIYDGWARGRVGNFDEGLPLMEEGLREWLATGSQLGGTGWLAGLAETYCDAGRLDECRATLERARQIIEGNEERFYESELTRVKAKLLLAASPSDPAAEIALRHAIDIAQQQQAAYFEIRARLELAKLYQHRGQPEKAREQLEPVRPRLGVEMAPRDAIEARRLLESVSPGGGG